jgi:hypothetical protein
MAQGQQLSVESITGQKGGGGGGFEGTQAAIQAFLQSTAQSTQKLQQIMQQMAQESAALNEQARMETSKGVQDVMNHTLAQAEREKERGERRVERAEDKEFSLQSSEYMAQLQQEAQEEAARIREQVAANQTAMTQYLNEWNRQKAVVPEANQSIRDQVMKLAQKGYWSRTENGMAQMKSILRSLDHSEAFNETHYSAPYLNQAIALYNQATDDILAGRDPDDLTGLAPQPVLLRLPDLIPEGTGEPLPEFTNEQLRAIQLREGYPSGGMLDETDPARAYANPLAYQSALKALMDEHIMADFTDVTIRREAVEEEVRRLLAADETLRSSEKFEVEVGKVFEPMAREAVIRGLSDVSLNAQDLKGQTLEDAIVDSIVNNIFKDQPESAQKALSLVYGSQPWEPQPEDLQETIMIRAGLQKVSENVLEALTTDPNFEKDVEFLLESLDNTIAGGVAYLGGGQSRGDKAADRKRALHSVASHVLYNLHGMIGQLDRSGPLTGLKEELSATSRTADRLLYQLSSAKDEEARSKLLAQAPEAIQAGMEGPKTAALPQAGMSQGSLVDRTLTASRNLQFKRAIGPIEAMGLSFTDRPDKMAPILDWTTGGKGNFQGPNASAYTEITKAVPVSPGRERLRTSTQKRLTAIAQRSQPSQPSFPQPRQFGQPGTGPSGLGQPQQPPQPGVQVGGGFAEEYGLVEPEPLQPMPEGMVPEGQ